MEAVLLQISRIQLSETNFIPGSVLHNHQVIDFASQQTFSGFLAVFSETEIDRIQRGRLPFKKFVASSGNITLIFSRHDQTVVVMLELWNVVFVDIARLYQREEFLKTDTKRFSSLVDIDKTNRCVFSGFVVSRLKESSSSLSARSGRNESTPQTPPGRKAPA